jgi:Tfp pilus assembly protein PilF
MVRVFCLSAILLSTVAISAQPTWIAMQNDNFRVYSTARERETRDALDQFERVRGFFIQLTGTPPGKPVPVSVVIFGSEKEYQPYRLNEFATAYYSSLSDRDLIVVGKLDEESSRVASHEYTHLVFRQEGYSLPPWLNEGMAELFSTLRATGADTEFGDALPERLKELQRETWVPLETILAVDQQSPYYNEKKQAGSFYDQSWALVHMLATTDKYRPKFWDIVKAINDGTPSVQALETAYSMPLARLETELQHYISGSRFNKLRITIKLGDTDNLKSEPADMFDVHEALAELLIGQEGKQAEARDRFEELAREDAKRPEPWANLGYLAWREGKPGEAAQRFGRAFDLGSRSPRLLLNFAQLAHQDKPEDCTAALMALLDLEPKNLDARLLLTQLQVQQGQFPEALVTAGSISVVRTAEQRDILLYLRAYTAMRVGDMSVARTQAQELKRVSSAQNMQQRADDILRISNRR